MNIINNFFKEIENALSTEPSYKDWELFNTLKDYFIENNDMIYKESEKISDLGYDMQDIIAEMSYMDDFTKCRKEISYLLQRMKKEVKND